MELEIHPDVQKFIDLHQSLAKKSREFFRTYQEQCREKGIAQKEFLAANKELLLLQYTDFFRSSVPQFFSREVLYATSGYPQIELNEYEFTGNDLITKEDYKQYSKLCEEVMSGKLILPFLKIALKKYGKKRIFVNKDELLELDPYSIIIHFPTMEYRSAHSRSEFKDCYVGLTPHLTIVGDGKAKITFEIFFLRTGYSLIDAYTNFDHGHIRGGPLGEVLFKKMCLGSAEILPARVFKTYDYKRSNVIYFFLCLNAFIKWESGAGGPYKRIDEVRRGVKSNIQDYWGCHRKMLQYINVSNLRNYLQKTIISKNGDKFIVENKHDFLKTITNDVRYYLACFKQIHVLFEEDNSGDFPEGLIDVAKQRFDSIKSRLGSFLRDSKHKTKRNGLANFKYEDSVITFHEDIPTDPDKLFVAQLYDKQAASEKKKIDISDPKVRKELFALKSKLSDDIIEAIDNRADALIKEFLVSDLEHKTYPKTTLSKKLSQNEKIQIFEECKEVFPE